MVAAMPVWSVILAHRHWVTFRLWEHEIRLCARCSGTVIGYFSTIFFLSLADLSSFHLLPPLGQISISFQLALPSAIDWLTQTWGYRTSTNSLRLSLGFLVGFGAGLLSLSPLTGTTKTLSLACLAFLVIAMGYVGRKLRNSGLVGSLRFN